MSQEPYAILVVDDSDVVRHVSRRILERRGFNVTTASGAAEALRLMEQELPDLVLLDLQMPRMNGADALKEIRRRWPGMPVIISTGYPPAEILDEALKHAPNAVISKPFTSDELIKPIEEALKR